MQTTQVSPLQMANVRFVSTSSRFAEETTQLSLTYDSGLAKFGETKEGYRTLTFNTALFILHCCEAFEYGHRTLCHYTNRGG